MSRFVAITSDPSTVESLREAFSDDEFEWIATVEEAVEGAKSGPCDFLFVDVTALAATPMADYREYRKTMYPLWRSYPGAHLVVLSSQERIREAVKAVKAGANDYLTHPVVPLEIEYLRDSASSAQRAQEELDYLRDQFWQAEAASLVRTNSPVMRAMFEQVRKVAPTRSTVLLTGETGTGKNVVASLLHKHSERVDRSFISLHCGAIPDTLLESELFGHEKGAFTGAIRRKLGKFEIADGGTLLLDEIGTITPAMQIKLLQVLQDGTLQRVGGERSIHVDVRILAATNMDLKAAVASGDFRKDLYYRLSIFPIEIPTLSARREDIPMLTRHFLAQHEQIYSRGIDDVHPQVLEAFDRYEWPGNVRELESLVERAYILESSSCLTPESFPDELFSSDEGVQPTAVPLDGSLAEARQHAVAESERLYLKEQLERYQGRIGATAHAAGITTRQLHTLMKRHGLRKETFRRQNRR